MEELVDEMTCSNKKKIIENKTNTLSDAVIKKQFDLNGMFPLDQLNSILEQNKIDFITETLNPESDYKNIVKEVTIEKITR
jgi:hypothetical protein